MVKFCIKYKNKVNYFYLELYQINQDVQRFLKIHFSKRNDNLFRFLIRSELENTKLINQFISLGICNSYSISIRRDPHSFLFETLLFYSLVFLLVIFTIL